MKKHTSNLDPSQKSDRLQSPNYTQLPNDIVDNYLEDLTGSEVKILLVVARKTIGYHKEVDSISSSQIVYFTGMNRDTVWKGISSLEEKGLLVVDRSGVGKMNKYTLNVDPSQKSDRSRNVSDFSDTENLDTGKTVYRKSDTQKIMNTKENHKQKKTDTEISADAEDFSKSVEKELDISEQDLEQIHQLLTAKDESYITKETLKSEISRNNWLFVLIYHINVRRGYKDFYQTEYRILNLRKQSKKLIESLDFNVEQVLQILISVMRDPFWDRPLEVSSWSQWVSLFKQQKKESMKDDW